MLKVITFLPVRFKEEEKKVEENVEEVKEIVEPKVEEVKEVAEPKAEEVYEQKAEVRDMFLFVFFFVAFFFFFSANLNSGFASFLVVFLALSTFFVHFKVKKTFLFLFLPSNTLDLFICRSSLLICVGRRFHFHK